jgi:hypothetical protein
VPSWDHRRFELKPTRWDLEVDPEGILRPAERYRRAEAARAAFYVAQGLAARKRNRERKAQREVPSEARSPDKSAEHEISIEERRLRGRLGGLRASAKRDPHQTTAAARAGAEASYERQVDPEGILPAAERTRRARAARAAFFARLSLQSVEARARRRHHVDDDAADAARQAQVAETRRKLTGRVGAYTMLARHDPAEATAKAREVLEMRWRRLVDPHGELAPDELNRRVDEAKSAHFRTLAQQSAQKRRR